MEATYKQCKLIRGNTEQVSWIPSNLAMKGKTIGFKEEGEWSEGWVVSSVAETEFPHSVLTKRERDYLNHRKATDI